MGMLLSLLGTTTTRHKALGLFNLKRSNPDYPGATHADIGNVFANAAGVKYWRWEYHSRFDFAVVSQSLSRHLRINRRPTLLSFGAVHRNGKWKCTHVAVVVRASDKMIELLDPLGSSPSWRRNANVWLMATDWPELIGSSYNINQENEVAVLRWAAKEPLCLGAE